MCEAEGMRREDMFPFDVAYLNRRMAELGLKRDWVAQAVGVNPKTVTRWTTGKVRRMAHENAGLLARCLQCSLDDLVDRADILTMGAYADREETIEHIISEDLLLLLSPSGNWRLLESIIKSSITPNLRADQVGKLYNWLSVAKWRRHDYDGAKAFAHKALELGRATGQQPIAAKALFNLGTIASITGKHHEALSLLTESYAGKCCLASADTASLCTNLSMVYRDMADFCRSLDYQHEAIGLFQMANRPYNLAIAHNCLGFIYVELGLFAKALEHLKQAMHYAHASNWQDGRVIIELYRLDALTLKGDLPASVSASIDEYLNGSYSDLFGYEFIARYFRHCADYEKAYETITIGLRRTERSPTERASLCHELARLEAATHKTEGAALALRSGNDLYSAMGLSRRLVEGAVPEYGQVFSQIADREPLKVSRQVLPR